MRIAIPVAQQKLCAHFGHCESFAIIDVDVARKTIESHNSLTPPPHEPGVLPRWLVEQGVQVVLAGGMGGRAIQALEHRGIEVIIGVPARDPETLASSYMAGEIAPGANACDH